jgi:hypothetical protein
MTLKEFWSPFCGAVSVTFDDGTENQLEKAIPPLDQLGIKATFYIHPHGDYWQERLFPWKDVAKKGHEIGNHSLSHTCSSNFLMTFGGLEEKSLSEIEQDILLAHKRLSEIAPHQQQWTFAYPCSNTFVGKGIQRQSYVPIIAKHFLAGRSAGEYGFANHPGVVDLACVWGISVERMSGFEMIGLVEELTHRALWVILIFHEIDGERLTVGSYDFKMLLNYLHRKRASIWTAPVIEVAKKIASSPPIGGKQPNGC